MRNERDKLLWLEYQLSQSTEESLLREAEELELEMKLEGIVMPEAPKGFIEKILERGKEIERDQLVEKWSGMCGTFEDICPTCGGRLTVIARAGKDQEQDSLCIRCERCKTQWV